MTINVSVNLPRFWVKFRPVDEPTRFFWVAILNNGIAQSIPPPKKLEDVRYFFDCLAFSGRQARAGFVRLNNEAQDWANMSEEELDWLDKKRDEAIHASSMASYRA